MSPSTDLCLKENFSTTITWTLIVYKQHNWYLHCRNWSDKGSSWTKSMHTCMHTLMLQEKSALHSRHMVQILCAGGRIFINFSGNLCVHIYIYNRKLLVMNMLRFFSTCSMILKVSYSNQLNILTCQLWTLHRWPF